MVIAQRTNNLRLFKVYRVLSLSQCHWCTFRQPCILKTAGEFFLSLVSTGKVITMHVLEN